MQEAMNQWLRFCVGDCDPTVISEPVLPLTPAEFDHRYSRSRQQFRPANLQGLSLWIIGRENPWGGLYEGAERPLSDHGNHGLFYGSSANSVVPKTVAVSIGTGHRADDEGVHL